MLFVKKAAATLNSAQSRDMFAVPDWLRRPAAAVAVLPEVNRITRGRPLGDGPPSRPGVEDRPSPAHHPSLLRPMRRNALTVDRRYVFFPSGESVFIFFVFFFSPEAEGCSVGHEVRRSRWCAVDRAWFPCGSEGEEACTCAVVVWSVAVAVADRVPVASAGLAAGFGVAEERTPPCAVLPPMTSVATLFFLPTPPPPPSQAGSSSSSSVGIYHHHADMADFQDVSEIPRFFLFLLLSFFPACLVSLFCIGGMWSRYRVAERSDPGFNLRPCPFLSGRASYAGVRSCITAWCTLKTLG